MCLGFTAVHSCPGEITVSAPRLTGDGCPPAAHWSGDRCQRADLWLWQASTNRKRVENIAKKKLDSLIKESKIRDCEDPNDFTVSTLSPSGKLGHRAEAKKVRPVLLTHAPPTASLRAG